ncbi:MAG: hypothetical protein NZM31_07890, partial [Gemmatales bacterium]|nr:hypothetical protein [Gemmatales bacterium]MDW8386915.1 hypothetical protein [Gemmatales bacterium]
MTRLIISLAAGLCALQPIWAGVGDPQVRTDHPWYPGELACSTFERLFATQADLYQRVTNRQVRTEEDKVLASWLWRNTHYWHGEDGGQDLWGRGLGQGPDNKQREYWTGLFAYGFALCGSTHAQWVGEMEELLGHGRGRSVGTAGHNSFEVFITGGEYGSGRWVLVDHDLSTVIFTPDGKRMMGLSEIALDWKRLTDRNFKPERQRGWLPCGLHPDDASSFSRFAVAEYLSGYAGPPPMVHLRRGETLRRYLEPGLDDGKTFVFWGRNYNTGGIPGPERSRTWVNQPEKMYRSRTGTPHIDGQARYANAVYTYMPDFTGDYREAVVSEDETQVTLEFATPFIIAATPANDKPWGTYDSGARNGLVLRGRPIGKVSVSVDRGRSWTEASMTTDTLDLTDAVKGHRQYWLRLHKPAKELVSSQLVITTVCQCNVAVIPRLKDNGSRVTFEAGGRAQVNAGPNLPQALAHLVAGKVDSPSVTLELATPRGEPIRQVYAAAHVRSGSPPDPRITYQIDFSRDGGRTWEPIVRDWRINRQGDEPPDFWSQSFCWGHVNLDGDVRSVQVRFSNSGGKAYLRPEAHLVYETRVTDPMRVTFAWTDDTGDHTHSHVVHGKTDDWTVPTGRNVRTRWI